VRTLRRPAAAALAAAFLAALALIRFDAQVAGLERVSRATPVYLDAGENILHRHLGETLASLRMPLYGVWEALLLDHFSYAARAGAMYAAILAQLALVFALGLLLGSAPGAFAGAAAYALLRYGAYSENASLEPFFAIFVTLAAAAAAWRANRPTPARSAFVGAAVGASLLCRSSLVFFPPWLAAWDWLAAGRPPLKRWWPHLAGLCLVPYLFLLPWIGMNWTIQRRFIPLESESRDSNVAMGAAGLVTGLYGEWREALDQPPPADGSTSVVLWAAGRVLRHPLRYARACLERLAFAAGRHPGLYAAAFLALALSLGLPPFRAVAAFAAYFLGIHSLMTVIPIYFIPLLPALVAAAAAGAGRLLRKPDLDENSPGYRGGVAVIKTVFAAALALSLFTAGLLARYARAGSLERLSDPANLDREIERHPRDPWLRAERAKGEMASDRAAAERDLTAALDARPGDPALTGLLAWTKLLRGDPAPLLALDSLHGAGDVNEFDTLKVVARLAAGDRAGALAQYDAAGVHDARSARVWREESLQESMAVLRLRTAHYAKFDGVLAEIATRHRSPAESAAVLASLVSLKPRSRALRRALALSLHESKEDARALSILEKLTREDPGDAPAWKDRGVCEFALGRVAAARRDLARALALEPGLLSASLSLGYVEAAAGNCAAARAVYRRALDSAADEAEIGLRPLLTDALSKPDCRD